MERRGSEGMKGGERERERNVEIGWTEGLTSPQAERRRERWQRKKKQRKEDASAGAFVKRCQIFSPEFCQYSCALGDEGPTAPILHINTHEKTHTLSPVSFVVLFLYPLNEYFITSNINIHSNGFAHSYYRYFLFFFFKQKYSLQILHTQALK